MTENETDIRNAANHMVQRYGADALREVDLRILELQARDEEEALELWREIRKTVSLLLQKQPDRGYQ